MSKTTLNNIGLKVGLEIHQQLDTKKKLFCNCNPIESDEFIFKFQRKLRPVKSELGKYDPAAIFESTKSKTIVYYGNPQSSCLVEQDEEPPHPVNDDAKKIALTIAAALDSKIFSEIFPMRKTVIDGSNTSGFQRTMLISQGGILKVDGEEIGVQSICLEEDAAKLLGDKGSTREYSLERLGVPLVEIALDPVEGEPKKIKHIALTLGRLLRSTRKVTRGIGSIRQDVNVSVKEGIGIVEVKGVQQLEQLEKVVEFEAKRQTGLVEIAKKLKELDIKVSKDDVFDITEKWKECNSKIIKKALKDKAIINALRIRNFSGMFGFSPFEGIRLGKEIGQLVKFYGIGGIFHSDELPNYGIEDKDIKIVQDVLKLGDKDAFLIIAAPTVKIEFALDSIITRIQEAKFGVPAETRLATQDGETIFLRPRPGASRMYPETDIPPIIPTKKEIEQAKQNIPKSWDESIKELKEKFNLNPQLAEQLYDSKYLDIFERIFAQKEDHDIADATFISSSLVSTIPSLERIGLNSELLTNQEIEKTMKLFREKKIPKESIEILFEDIMSGKSKTVEEAMKNTSIKAVKESELEGIIEQIVEKNKDIVKNQKERAVGPLMGIVMKELRGKASGEIINKILREKIQEILKR